MSILMSTTAFAATTYYIDVTLAGPDANGVSQTVTGSSSKYGALTDPLVYTVVQVINAKLETIETVYAGTGLSRIVYDGIAAFTEGEAAWNAYGDSHADNVTGEFKQTLRNLESTFADLTVNEANELTYRSAEGDVYAVTITLKKYRTGSGGGGQTGGTQPGGEQPGSATEECPRNEQCPAGYLTDLDPQAWYHDGVHYCVENGLMAGYPDGKFGPDDLLTRAQVVRILYNRENKPAVAASNVFNDVAASAWYAPAITWAVNAGVAIGYGNGDFGPEDSMTREQLASMLYQYSKYKGYDNSAYENVKFLVFADADTISDWAIDAVKWAYAAKIVEGMGDGTLNPAGNATRAQAASMFMHFFQNVAG